jgi:hypothetical protein
MASVAYVSSFQLVGMKFNAVRLYIFVKQKTAMEATKPLKLESKNT